MGLFDDITCEMPLPERPEWMKDFQTKDTPAQYMEHYQIREDGTLWHEEYDVEDRSDPNAEGLMALGGCMTRVNKRWVQVEGFDGAIDFYNSNWAGTSGDLLLLAPGTGSKYVSVEYRVVFVDGKVVKGPVLLEREEREDENVFTDSAAWQAASDKRKAEIDAEWKASGMEWTDFVRDRMRKARTAPSPLPDTERSEP